MTAQVASYVAHIRALDTIANSAPSADHWDISNALQECVARLTEELGILLVEEVLGSD